MAEHRHSPDTTYRQPVALEPQAEAQDGPNEEPVAVVLKGSREQYGRSLREVADVLNIRFVYLEAIEAGEFDKLPGTAYAIGFVRSYADYLGLDSKDLVRRFKAEVAGLSKQTQLVFPTPVPEGKVPGGALILVSVLCLALAYGAWTFFSSRTTQVADLVPAVPERLQPLIDEAPAEGSGISAGAPYSLADSGGAGSSETVPADATMIESPPMEVGLPPQTGEAAAATEASGAAEAADPPPEAAADAPAPAAETPSAAPVEVTAAPAESAPAAPSSPAPAPEPAPAAAPAEDAAPAADPATPELAAIPAAPSSDSADVALAAPTPQVYGRENADSRIILRALQDSWVQVRDSRDDLLLTRVLRAGDSYRVPNQPGLTLLTGNAGGLEIEVDGSSLGPVGPVGSVRRNVALDPARLLNGAAPTQ